MRTALWVLGAAALVVACEDGVTKAAAPDAAPVAALVPAAKGPSGQELLERAKADKATRVCAAYMRARTRLQKELVETPDDSTLQAKATALASVITDACN